MGELGGDIVGSTGKGKPDACCFDLAGDGDGCVGAGSVGEFDYYVLSLSWSPNWCAYEGDARGSDQCDARHDHGWILHGLWPQYHRGWPEYCKTAERPPSRAMTRDMADIMGTSGLAWHQWKKHGVCSGLSAAAYYALSREAYGRVVRPPVFRKLEKAVKLPASVVEEAFLQANPGMVPDGVTITWSRRAYPGNPDMPVSGP